MMANHGPWRMNLKKQLMKSLTNLMVIGLIDSIFLTSLNFNSNVLSSNIPRSSSQFINHSLRTRDGNINNDNNDSNKIDPSNQIGKTNSNDQSAQNNSLNPSTNFFQSTDLSSSNVGKIRLKRVEPICNNSSDVSLAGYIDLDSRRSMFFWYFQARVNPDQAPLILWLNGGPGSSSMIGLFQENGPCRVRIDSSGFDFNPESWNEMANMLYLDQPIGVGYSTGRKNVSSTNEAAVDVYEALQIFLLHPTFSSLNGRPFGLWTESYGGRYGPLIISYILKKNSEVSKNSNSGNKNVVIPVTSVGIGNGLTNPVLQYFSYITFSKDNPHHPNLVSDETIKTAEQDYSRPGGCKDQIDQCNQKNDDSSCNSALNFCESKIMSKLSGDRDIYDVRTISPSKYPPNLTDLLNEPKFKESIQFPLNLNWSESNDEVFANFVTTGDGVRNSVTNLEEIVNAGIRTLIYAGDADYIVNYQGVEKMVENLKTRLTDRYSKQGFNDWTLEGELVGQFKTVENLSYLRIYDAGHEVPAYGIGSLPVGRAARTFFEQTISNKPISGDGVKLKSTSFRKNSSSSPSASSSSSSSLSSLSSLNKVLIFKFNNKHQKNNPNNRNSNINRNKGSITFFWSFTSNLINLELNLISFGTLVLVNFMFLNFC